MKKARELLEIEYTGNDEVLSEHGIPPLIEGRAAEFIPYYNETNKSGKDIIVYLSSELLEELHDPDTLAEAIANIRVNSKDEERVRDAILIKVIEPKLKGKRINHEFYQALMELNRIHERIHLEQDYQFSEEKSQTTIANLIPPKESDKSPLNTEYIEYWNNQAIELQYIEDILYTLQEIHAIVGSYLRNTSSEYNSAIFLDALLVTLLGNNKENKTLDSLFSSLSFDDKEFAEFGRGLTLSRHAYLAIIMGNPEWVYQLGENSEMVTAYREIVSELVLDPEFSIDQVAFKDISNKTLALFKKVYAQYNELVASIEETSTEYLKRLRQSK